MAGYVDLNRNTGAWETVYINVPSGASVARLRLMAKQNGANDYAGFDDVSIFSSTEDVIAPLVTGAEVTGANSIRVHFSELMDQASVEAPANYTADAAISTISYTEPGDGFSLADITFTEDFAAGEAYSLTVGLVTDAAGNFLILEVEQLINGEPGSIQRLVVLIKDNDIVAPVPPASPEISLIHLGSYESGSSAEIVAHAPGSQRLFIANATENRLDIIDFSDPSSLGPVNSIDLSVLYDGEVNSVAVHDGVAAVAMAARATGMNGSILFFEPNGFLQSTVEVGPLPDMLTFTPDGSKLLVANEGELRSDYREDPEGSVSIIDMEAGMGNILDTDVVTLSFAGFNADSASLVAQGVRIFGPGATVAQDLEPEYIAVSDDGATAYVVCQENNALVIVDIETATATGILPLGYKDWSAEGILFDASDRAPDIFFANWPVKGMYQPGAIDYFTVGGRPTSSRPTKAMPATTMPSAKSSASATMRSCSTPMPSRMPNT